MAKKRGRPSGPREADPSLTAKSFIDKVIRKTEGKPEPISTVKNPDRVARAKQAGKSGGPARAAALSAEQRRQIAMNAAASRWGQKN